MEVDQQIGYLKKCGDKLID